MGGLALSPGSSFKWSILQAVEQGMWRICREALSGRGPERWGVRPWSSRRAGLESSFPDECSRDPSVSSQELSLCACESAGKTPLSRDVGASCWFPLEAVAGGAPACVFPFSCLLSGKCLSSEESDLREPHFLPTKWE